MDNTFFPENDYRSYLSHGGPGSGRYPKGSGKNPYQHTPGGRVQGGSKPKTTKVINAAPPTRKTYNVSSEKEDSSSWFEPKFKAGKDKAPVSAAERTLQTSDKMIQNTTDVINAARVFNGNKKQSAAANLSDEELTAALKRLRMEAEFDRLTGPETADGFDKATAILSMFGSAIGIVGGVATILSTVQAMKK